MGIWGPGFKLACGGLNPYAVYEAVRVVLKSFGCLPGMQKQSEFWQYGWRFF